MTEPDFGEVCFLIAVIIFVIAAILAFPRPNAWPYYGILLPLGLAVLALGFLAL